MAKSEKKSEEQNKADFLKASKSGAKIWKQKRTVDPGQGFSQPELDDGQYIARHSKMTVGTTKAKLPYVSWTFVIAEGEDKGKRPNKFYNLDKEVGMEQLSKDLQRAGFDIADLELSEIPGLADEMNEDKPYLRISVKNNEAEVKDPKTGKKVTKTFLNIFVDSLLEDYEPEDDEEEEEEKEEDTKKGKKSKKDEDEDEKPKGKGKGKKKDEEEEEEEEDEEDEEEEDDGIPEKGDAVLYKPKGKKKATEFTVTKVNTKAETCDLKNEDGDVHKGVAFDAVEIQFADDEEEEEE